MFWPRYRFYRAPKADTSPRHGVIVLFGILVYSCMAGFLATFLARDQSGPLRWQDLAESLPLAFFTVGLVGSAAGTVFLTEYYKDPQVRWGAVTLLCVLPLTVCAFLAFEFVEIRLSRQD